MRWKFGFIFLETAYVKVWGMLLVRGAFGEVQAQQQAILRGYSYFKERDITGSSVLAGEFRIVTGMIDFLTRV